MGVKASPEAIRKIKKDISGTIKDLEHMNDGIKNGIRATGTWDDDKAAEFNMIMQKVARLTQSPIDTLKAALPKLEKLAMLLDSYNSQSMNG